MIYRTNHFTDDERRDLERSAKNQEEEILDLYKKHHPRALSPSQVHRMTGYKWPITSVRRAITNLTNKGALQKTDRTVEGQYGRPECMWRVRTGRQEQMEMLI